MAHADPTRIECFFDGACPGNQFGKKGSMRAAFVIGNHTFVREVPDLLTPKGSLRSNNIAEYSGLISLLRELADLDDREGRRRCYVICGDSQLVIRQMTGEYRVRKDHLRTLNSEARRRSVGLDVTFRAVPRSHNRAGFLLE